MTNDDTGATSSYSRQDDGLGRLGQTSQPANATHDGDDGNPIRPRQLGADEPTGSGDSTSLTYGLNAELAPIVCGDCDSTIKALRKLIACDFFVRGEMIQITGPAAEVQRARRVLNELQSMAQRGHPIAVDTVTYALDMVTAENAETVRDKLSHEIVGRRGKIIRPKSRGQQAYVDAIDTHTVVFGVGPAGSGKTYLAVAKAVEALQSKAVTRIILTRPAVEAGEKLGFLPGTLTEKIDPYLRPLYDALREMLDPEAITKLMESGVIEVAPLAYMRGRTLNDAFVILDEAQNTTPEQMKMFLTRLGFGSTMVITGDVTQVDLPGRQPSGLHVVRRIVEGVHGVYWADLDSGDVVRHPLVGAIVDAYDRYDREREQQRWETNTATRRDSNAR